MKMFILIMIGVFSNVSFSKEKDFTFVSISAPISNMTNGLGINIGSLRSESFNFLGSMEMTGTQYKESGISYNKATSFFNDTAQGDRFRSLNFQFGTIYQLNSEWYIGSTFGYQSRKRLTKFYDKFEILGDNGTYYVERDSEGSFSGGIRAFYKMKDSKLILGMGYSYSDFGTYLSIGGYW